MRIVFGLGLRGYKAFMVCYCVSMVMDVEEASLVATTATKLSG